MSFDFALLKSCSHAIVDERVYLDDAKRFIRFNRLPAIIGQVTSISGSHEFNKWDLTVNIDGVTVPRDGLDSVMQIVGVSPGPYTIRKNMNDLLKIHISETNTTFSVTLPVGERIPIEQIIYSINRVLGSGKYYSRSVDGKLWIGSSLSIKKHYIKIIDPSVIDTDKEELDTNRILGAYKSLGLTPGRVSYCRNIFPSWKVVDSSDSDTQDPGIKFDYAIRNANPVITLNYVATPQTCGRCQGSAMENDYNAISGSYEELRDLDLLAQESDKFLFTRKGSHFRWPWLGSTVVDTIGAKTTAVSSTTIYSSLTEAFNIYQNIKSQQLSGFAIQKVSDLEFPRSLSNINLRTDESDPTVKYVNLSVTSRALQATEYTRPISDPPLFSVLGASGNRLFSTSNGYIIR